MTSPNVYVRRAQGLLCRQRHNCIPKYKKTPKGQVSMANNRISITHSYDEDADVLYVRTSGDQEPTFVENVDDVLLLEVGWFSGLPKGFRVLGPNTTTL